MYVLAPERGAWVGISDTLTVSHVDRMRDTPRIFRAVAGNAHVPSEGGLGFAGWFKDSPVRVPEPLKSFHPWQPRKETATSSG